MRRLNADGISILEYKNELLKDYSKIVKDSLIVTINQKAQENAWDDEIIKILLDSNVEMLQFRNTLIENKRFVKTEEEFLKDFAIYKDKLLNHLENKNILVNIDIEPLPEKESIYIYKHYDIAEVFVMNYFGIKEDEMLPLMKRKGFIETFSVLRLGKIFNDIFNTLTIRTDVLKCRYSPVYHYSQKNCYTIDVIIEVPIERFEMQDDYDITIKEIEKILIDINKLYMSKMDIGLGQEV